MTDLFAYTLIPILPEEKVPALGAGFHYEDFYYGQDYRAGDTRQAGHVTAANAELFVIDVDEPKPYGDGTMPPAFADTHLGELILKLVLAFPLITYVSSASPQTKYHVYVDTRAWGLDWPQQWATAQWPYDVKSNGFVRAEPAYVPLAGVPAQLPNDVIALILAAIGQDRAVHDQLSSEHNGTAQGNSTGATGSWTPDMPDGSITDDNTLTAAIMSMVAHGLEDDEIFEQAERVKAPLEEDWTEDQIQGKIDSARLKMDSDPLVVRRFFKAFVSETRRERLIAEADAEYELQLARIASGRVSSEPAPYWDDDTLVLAQPLQGDLWVPRGSTDQDQADSALDEIHRRGQYLYIKEHGRLAVNAGDHWELLGAKGSCSGTLCSWLAWYIEDSSYPYDAGESKELKKEVPGWKDDEGLDEEQVAHRNEARAKLREYRKHEDWLKWRTSAQVSGVVSKMETLLDTAAMAKSALLADNDPMILWAGGIPWDLRTCTPAQGIKRSTLHFLTAQYVPAFPAPGVPELPTPLFDQWMHAVVPDETIREWVLNMMGATLIGGGKFFPQLVSRGGNTGKTSTVELLADLLGSYAEVLPEELLTGAQSHSEIFLRLKGKKLAYFDEQPGSGKTSRNKLKSLAGSSRLSGRAVNGREVVSFKPSHTLWLTVNDDILFGQDEALQMRVRRVLYEGDTSEVTAAEKAIWLPGHNLATPGWVAEAPAVLGKLMLRCQWYMQDSTIITAPPKAQQQLKKQIQKQNTVYQWFSSCVLAKPGSKVSNDNLRSAYTAWCKSVGVMDRDRVSDAGQFGIAMGDAVKAAEFNAERYTTGDHRGWEGLALSPLAQQVL